MSKPKRPKPSKPKPDVAERIVNNMPPNAEPQLWIKHIRTALRAHGKRAFTDGWKARNHMTYSQCKAYHDLARPYGIDPRNLP